MKHQTIRHEEPIYTSRILDFYFSDMNLGVLDIETTGLNPSRNKFILGGIYNEHEKTVHQIFAQTRSEEKSALELFLDEICKTDVVITYNGKHFDMPFIYRRMAANGINAEMPLPYNLDLYLVLNGHSPVKKFVPNLKQKTVENYMGLWQTRKDEISGGESVELYNMYEKTGDPSLEEKILLHNSDDVQQLTRLLRIISKCDFHKAMYHLGFPAGPLIIEKIRTERDFLIFTGKQRKHPFDYMGFMFNDQPAEIKFDMRSSSFTVKLPLVRQSGLGIADLEALGIAADQFSIYPTYSSGFLAIEQNSQKNYMEINHLIKSFIQLFFERKDI
ncbi:MAG: ribonuclease H-like domain-containing protein [Lentihominibacter sp.]